jgi:hypothetical protein
MIGSASATSGHALLADGSGGAAFGAVPWGSLSGVPAGFADGTDANTTYTAGAGLALTGSSFGFGTTFAGTFSFSGYAQGNDGFGVTATSGRSLWILPDRCQGCSNGLVQTGDVSMIFSQGTIGTGNLVLGPWTSGNRGLRMLSTGEVGIGKVTPSTALDVEGTVTATNLATTTPWIDLLASAGWSHTDAKCRVVNGWIELRGLSSKTLAAGWPVESPVLLPVGCRPQSTRYTETPCHGGGGPRNIVCNNDYQPSGAIGIHSDASTIQQRWEGVRIWGGP